ncbi:uncharacterized protein B0T15DRAFT_393792 [Chaetomium strumarium]|uniref:Hikeshi-like domain-containing protein n=1 Tax=Chaetomium strumarium TaxID=1170767 RepID=A0AAJ0GVP0_9PEZI|nr:hypothetical protein B0T15DRAFT_393792 [Chaetomium strumarium]
MSQPLFGLVPAGLPMIINPTEAPTPTSFLYAIRPAQPQKPFSHIAVFVLPDVILPAGTAAAIYLVTPPTSPEQTAPDSNFLGGIGPGKESAVFKLNTAPGESVVIGISIEPAESVAARMTEHSSSKTATTTTTGDAASGALVPARTGQQPSTLVLAQRIIKNAFNFLASFSGTAGQVEVVPLKAFEEWWKKFENKVRTDPGFLERDD